MFELNGRTALVTGAGQNVGAGIARALAYRGAHVVVNDLRPERAEAVVAEIEALGGTARPSAFDVTDHAAVRSAVDGLPPVDILVNNAGIVDDMAVTQFRQTSPADWDGTIRLNVQGVMNCCHATVDGMCDRGWGRIITISSGAGTSGSRFGITAYSAGKGGGIAFTRALAMEVARDGVTANTVALGMMRTGDDGVDESLGRTVPVGRIGTPDDVWPAVLWLASEEAAWVTGQTVEVNGGAITT
jgi:3-oxoacyl-[acyl-carrier protein] reductase